MPQRSDRADEGWLHPGVGGRSDNEHVTSPSPLADPGGLLGVLNRCSGHSVTSVTPCVTHVEQIGWRPGHSVDWPEWVPVTVRGVLRAAGIDRPWSHQSEAADLAHSGRDVVVSMPAAAPVIIFSGVPAESAVG